MTIRAAEPKYGTVVDDWEPPHTHDAECENCEKPIHQLRDGDWFHVDTDKELCVTDLPPSRGDPESWFAPLVKGGDGYLRYLCTRCNCTRNEEDGDNRRDEWCDDSECPCHATVDTL